MKFELKALEQLINVAVNPAQLTRPLLTDEFILECKCLLKTEIDKISEALKTAAVNNTEGKCAEHHFRHQIVEITQLSDTVFKYHQQLAIEAGDVISRDCILLAFYKEMIKQLNQVLEYIKVVFPVYFDASLKITDAKKKSLELENAGSLKLIDKELRKIGVPEDLITIACVPFREFCIPNKVTSYNDIHFLSVYQNEFTVFIAEINCTKNATKQFCELLVFLNFNSARFYNYLITDIQEHCDSCRNLPEQMIQLYLQLKWVNQLLVKPRISLRPEMPTLKEQVGSWITEELFFFRQAKATPGPCS